MRTLWSKQLFRRAGALLAAVSLCTLLAACEAPQAAVSPVSSAAVTAATAAASTAAASSALPASSAPSQPPASSTVASSQPDTVRYYFPRGGQNAQQQLLGVISAARKTLDVAIYSFTDQQVGTALQQAKALGVTVRVITDREQSASKSQKTVLNALKKAGIPIKLNTHSGIMHLKVTIADHAVATTGSFNYTKAAETSNDEVFVVLDSPTAAADFETQFERMWNDTKGFKNY